MILDHASDLTRDAAAVRERRELSHQRSAWQTHVTRFTHLRERLAAAVQFLGWLGSVSEVAPPPLPGAALAAALGGVTKLHEAIRAEPATVLAGNQAPDAASQVDAVVRQMEDQARSAWSDHLDRDGWIPASLWTPFQTSDAYVGAVRQAEQQDRDRSVFTTLAFPTQAEQRDYERLTTARAALLHRLPDTSDEEVRTFLIDATGAGVPLAAYSATVAAWLEKHGLADRYVIRTRT